MNLCNAPYETKTKEKSSCFLIWFIFSCDDCFGPFIYALDNPIVKKKVDHMAISHTGKL